MKLRSRKRGVRFVQSAELSEIMIAFVYSSRSSPDTANRVLRVLRWLVEQRVERALLALCDELTKRSVAECPERPALHILTAPAPGGLATALRAAADHLGPAVFLVVDAARFVPFELDALRAEHASSPAIATLALRLRIVDALDRRVDVDRAGRILAIVPGGAGQELDVVTTGTCLVEPELLRHVPAGQVFGLEDGLFPLVIRSGGILSGLLVVDGLRGRASSAGAATRR